MFLLDVEDDQQWHAAEDEKHEQDGRSELCPCSLLSWVATRCACSTCKESTPQHALSSATSAFHLQARASCLTLARSAWTASRSPWGPTPWRRPPARCCRSVATDWMEGLVPRSAAVMCGRTLAACTLAGCSSRAGLDHWRRRKCGWLCDSLAVGCPEMRAARPLLRRC